MKTYELAYIISPEITLEQALEKAKEIESAVQSREGIILKQLNPVAKTLAFPIAKRASGFFGVLEFQLDPEKLIEVKGIIEKDGKIVRHMVIIKEILKPRKIRRSKPSMTVEAETKVEANQNLETEDKKDEPAFAEGFGVAKEKEKVELKDIEEKLEELLG